MTTNQLRAVSLADEILRGRVPATSLSDQDWHLLLLAAGLNEWRACPQRVSRRVRDLAHRRAGYFSPPPGGRPPQPRRSALGEIGFVDEPAELEGILA